MNRAFRGRPPAPSGLGYLIDMDGVIYRGGRLIPGADQFIAKLLEAGTPFRFLTNNSQRTRRDVATRLQRMGIPVRDEHVYTCAMATARYLARQRPGGTAYVIGEGGLLNALHENGYAVVDKDPDYVVVGEGRTISFEMVEAAVRMILKGAKLIATNPDPNCPTEQGLRPGCGAIVAMIESASGVKAFSPGKPSPLMLRGARKELGLTTDQTVVIGDTMETDILGGVQLGFKTVLVLSGGTNREDLSDYAYLPDKIVDSIADLDPTQLACEFGAAAADTPSDPLPASLPRHDRRHSSHRREVVLTSEVL
ncbi:HAD-IIA family hydrolase [Paludisphaera rhizosphaerae]|uniref:HAD-IIA family hydrolase n=1 Tax=Paludisphaera rhizosphaerae TaxID=2711216 RepID=UPI0019801198